MKLGEHIRFPRERLPSLWPPIRFAFPLQYWNYIWGWNAYAQIAYGVGSPHNRVTCLNYCCMYDNVMVGCNKLNIIDMHFGTFANRQIVLGNKIPFWGSQVLPILDKSTICSLDGLDVRLSPEQPGFKSWKQKLLRKERKRNIKVFTPNMRCLFTASISCPHEHESEGGLLLIFIGGPRG